MRPEGVPEERSIPHRRRRIPEGREISTDLMEMDSAVVSACKNFEISQFCRGDSVRKSEDPQAARALRRFEYEDAFLKPRHVVQKRQPGKKHPL